MSDAAPPRIDYGPWAIARLREGAELTSIDSNRLDGHAQEFLGICRALNGHGDRRVMFDDWARVHPQGKDIISRVFAVPGHLADYPEPPETKDESRTTVYVDVPPLPKAARLVDSMETAATDTGAFIQKWQGYIAAIVNTIPPEFAEAGALTLWSIAAARRVHVPTYFEPEIYPNIWSLWVAESTVFHKTTALNAHRRLIRRVMPYLLLPEETSGDRLIQEMAGMDPVNLGQMHGEDQARWRKAKLHAGQRGIVIDEASSLFSGFRKDYNIGKIETFLKAYDCDDEKVFSTIRHGSIHLRWLYMPLLGATTPAAIQGAANLQMWEMGFWPRFVLLVPERMFPDPLISSDELISRPVDIDNALSQFIGALPQMDEQFEMGERVIRPPTSIEVSYTKEAWKHWTKFNDAMSYTLQHPDVMPDSRLRKMYGRFPVKLLQVATLLACMDWNGEGAPKINMAHYARAHQIVERWRVNAHRFVEVMSRPLTGEDRERRILNTIERVQAAGGLATTREIHRHTGWPRDQLEALLSQMERDNLLGQVESESKRTKVWKVSQ